MEFSEPTRIVFNRIKKFEPESATKIIGYLLLQEQEMIHLATGPDIVIREVVHKAKAELQQLAIKSASSPISSAMISLVNEVRFQFNPFSSRPPVSPSGHIVPSCWDHQVTNKNNSDFVQLGYLDSMNELHDHTQFLSLEDQMEHVNLGSIGFSGDCYYSDAAFNNVGSRSGRPYRSLTAELPMKTCHYFNKGFCKHGSNCRYYHGQVSESFTQMYGQNSPDGLSDDHVFSPGSLEKLELEIIELLKARRGNPISIASLPMLYYEKYGKVLQADGYLTESQRHGKAGYSLTKLLARLKKSIRLIDRPHGQHAVILAEDAPKYLENRNERSDPGPIVRGSRQIYLTFPSESTFTEDDVSNYFSTFGTVEDVRIPCQQKRMFGFVTFASTDTVKMILAKGNPHFVCGARVLVKPYREKLKLVDRKYQERLESSMYFPLHYVDMDSELHSFSRGCETSRFMRKQIFEEQEQAFELERRHVAGLQLVRKPMANPPYFGYSLDGLKVSEGLQSFLIICVYRFYVFSFAFSKISLSTCLGFHSDHLNFTSAEHFNYLFHVWSGSTTDDRVKHVDTNYTDQESEDLNLPDSPFATPIASGISTVT